MFSISLSQPHPNSVSIVVSIIQCVCFVEPTGESDNRISLLEVLPEIYFLSG